MKILVHSNAPWAGTGYGQQCGQLAQRLALAGHDPAISAFYGLNGASLNWNGMMVFPAGYDVYSNDVLVSHATQHFDGDPYGGLVITLVDVYVLQSEQLARTHTACWVPVDHAPAPPKVIESLEQSGVHPIAMSRFGQQMLKDAGLDAFYAPHGIDTTRFRPRSDEERMEMRRRLEMPEDAFLVGMVAANKGTPPRKGWPQAIAAFAQFARDHDDARLFVHSDPNGYFQGVNLHAMLDFYGLLPKVRFTDPYVGQVLGSSPEFVAELYGTFDVLLNPSYGEGFGIPIVEAQACGTPVIVTDWTAMTELCGAGWLVEGDRVFTEQHAEWMVPAVGSIVAALEQAYAPPAGLREAARKFALGYDADRVFAEHWVPTLAELERRMAPLELPVSA